MSIKIYISIDLYIYIIYTSIHLYIYTSMLLYISVCYIHIYLKIYISVCYIYISTNVYKYLYIYICMHLCIYISNLYIYMDNYRYLYQYQYQYLYIYQSIPTLNYTNLPHALQPVNMLHDSMCHSISQTRLLADFDLGHATHAAHTRFPSFAPWDLATSTMRSTLA